MKPTIGRIVHYIDSSVHFAAIITKVWSDTCVNLHIFHNNSDKLSDPRDRTSVLFSEMNDEYSWHWPERD